MYYLKIDNDEYNLLCAALQDSKERILKRINEFRSTYLELPENLKFLWKDEEAYKTYAEGLIKDGINQLNQIGELEAKLEKIV